MTFTKNSCFFFLVLACFFLVGPCDNNTESKVLEGGDLKHLINVKLWKGFLKMTTVLPRSEGEMWSGDTIIRMSDNSTFERKIGGWNSITISITDPNGAKAVLEINNNMNPVHGSISSPPYKWSFDIDPDDRERTLTNWQKMKDGENGEEVLLGTDSLILFQALDLEKQSALQDAFQ